MKQACKLLILVNLALSLCSLAIAQETYDLSPAYDKGGSMVLDNSVNIILKDNQDSSASTRPTVLDYGEFQRVRYTIVDILPDGNIAVNYEFLSFDGSGQTGSQEFSRNQSQLKKLEGQTFRVTWSPQGEILDVAKPDSFPAELQAIFDTLRSVLRANVYFLERPSGMVSPGYTWTFLRTNKMFVFDNFIDIESDCRGHFVGLVKQDGIELFKLEYDCDLMMSTGSGTYSQEGEMQGTLYLQPGKNIIWKQEIISTSDLTQISPNGEEGLQQVIKMGITRASDQEIGQQ